MVRIFTFLVCIFLSLNAIAICPKKDVEVAFKRKYGKVLYNYNLTHKDFEKYSPAPMSRIVRGLTVGELGVSYGADGRVFKHKDGYCAGVKKVDFYIGYDNFKVFIDKKYKRNTCEFRKNMKMNMWLFLMKLWNFLRQILKKPLKELLQKSDLKRCIHKQGLNKFLINKPMKYFEKFNLC